MEAELFFLLESANAAQAQKDHDAELSPVNDAAPLTLLVLLRQFHHVGASLPQYLLRTWLAKMSARVKHHSYLLLKQYVSFLAAPWVRVAHHYSPLLMHWQLLLFGVVVKLACQNVLTFFADFSRPLYWHPPVEPLGDTANHFLFSPTI